MIEQYKQYFIKEELNNEIWKDVGGCKGYEDFKGLYEISNMGRLRSKDRWIRTSRGNGKVLRKGKILKQVKCGSGYLKAMLTKSKHKVNVMIHRLVALAFLPNPNNYSQVNHIDEDKFDNRVDNLEWCSASYNVNYGTRNEKTSKTNSVSLLGNNNALTRAIIMYDKQGNKLREFNSARAAERYLDNPSAHYSIGDCCRGKAKTAYGYKWKYADEK